MSTGVLGDSGSSHHLQGHNGGTGSGRLLWLDRLAAWGKGSQLTPLPGQSWELLGTPGEPGRVKSKEGF